MPRTTVDLDARIEALLARDDWWQLPPEMHAEMYDILFQLYIEGFNKEAARIEALRLGMTRPPFVALDWDIQNPTVIELVQRHAAEMVRNVNEGTKFYLREMIKEGVTAGEGTTQMVKRIQNDLFGLEPAEAVKLPRDRLKSIVNYETNRAMSAAAYLLRGQLGLRKKQWFVNNVSPCDICLDNQAKGQVPENYLYEGVFGQILYPPAHPRTCRCVVMAVESEVRALGQTYIDWPLTRQEARLPRIPP